VGIDRSRTRLKKRGYTFTPYPVPSRGIPLVDLKLPPEQEIIVFERGGEQRALDMQEMAYHHVAQGELAGQPYLISF